MPGHLLLTIPISHYCEKARWALDRARIPYREERHVQGVHIFHALRAGRSRTMPILVTADGRRCTESAAIVRWCDGELAEPGRLVPRGALGEQAGALEAELDVGLGVDGRLWMYHPTGRSSVCGPRTARSPAWPSSPTRSPSSPSSRTRCVRSGPWRRRCARLGRSVTPSGAWPRSPRRSSSSQSPPPACPSSPTGCRRSSPR
ncbi:MAG: glutathione S-transferase N-terminal domain-containing protein [Solirubrobacterales bacterium]|nr:glutathione S-transferase N-terminal domain-containing protein [Solirubrobacterales bacterium]